MINQTLFMKEIKSNGILFLIFLAVLTMYITIITTMFNPEMGEGLKLFAESMPEVFAAMGMNNAGTTLLEFQVSYLYGMILLVFPAVFILICAGRLISRYVSDGSMAYLLAAPQKRRNIVFSQAIFLIFSIVLMLLYVTVLQIFASEILFPNQLNISSLLKINIGLLGLWIFFGGISFMVSCIINDAKKVSGINASVVIYSLLVQMIAQVGEKFENLKFITPLTLFNPHELMEGNAHSWWSCTALYLTGIIFFLIGINRFCKRDLPL